MIASARDGVLRHADNQRIRENGVLLRGAAASLLEHSDGRSVAVEILVAPAIVEVSAATRVIAIGETRIKPSCSVLCPPRSQEALREAWLHSILFNPSEAKIGLLLLLVCYAHLRSPSGRVPIPLTNGRISELCAVTERSVNRAVVPWVESGALRRDRQGYEVRDPVRLNTDITHILRELSALTALSSLSAVDP
ncbi:MAG: winged helix-turn-helix domain-containing protein [Deltaproteobacteria bacterium]|nr:winged helix-turn-helix domain-containing protein [Deltaproteobacteria bacterium]